MGDLSSTTGIQDDIGLCDVVSVVAVCPDDGSYLLLGPAKGKEIYWIFSGPARGQSWRMAARELILENMSVDTSLERLIKVYNVWVPDDANLHHAIFEVPFTNEEKKKLKVNNNKLKSRWFSVPDIQMLSVKGALRSPELLDYLPGAKRKNKVSAFPTHPEGYEVDPPTLTSTDCLVEIFEQNVIVQTELETGNVYEQLVKLSNLQNKEQVMIYREFLSLCFPNLLMNQTTFETFMISFGWKQDLASNLFHAADTMDHLALTFKEFLFILAACEPKTPHGGRPAEIRCRYIFRFFDMNHDNRLDYDELKQMLIAIRMSKNQPVRTPSIEKELDTCNRELGLSSKADMTLALFMRSVGDLKFRGTSALLRSPTSVVEFLINRSSAPYMTLIDTTASSLFREEKKRTSSGLTTSDVPLVMKIMKQHQQENFEMAGYIAKVGKDGLKQMDPLDDVIYAKTTSVTDTFLRQSSVELFSPRFPSNEILAGLHYFTEKIDAIDTKKTGRKPKPAYNWGQVDFNGFGNCLINIAEMVAEVVALEPRLVRVTSPVYVMGDFHGNFPDLRCFESLLWKLGPNLCPCNLLFLGDYVDRGVHGVEVVAYLFSYKLLNTHKLTLIRGNHEIREVQKMFTFLTECQKKFGKDLGYNVWNSVNKVFDNLPLAAIIDGKIFCCHGGIPPPWLCPTVESINNIPVPLHSPEEQSSLAWEIMWNDPVRQVEMNDKLEMEFQANEGFALNIKRGTAHMFNTTALQRFLNVNELSHVIRAHEAMQAGFQIHQTGKLLTVFSSSHYCGGNNEAACILVFKKELRIFRIDTRDCCQ